MYAPEIIEVKDLLEDLKKKNIIKEWELPYENLLTRRSAAILFLEPIEETSSHLQLIWEALSKYDNFSQRINEEKKLSQMKYRVTFSMEEREKNSKLKSTAEAAQPVKTN